MIDHLNLRLGQNGYLEIQDRTDEASKTVDLWLYTNPGIYVNNILPWTYVLNGVEASWQSFTVHTGTISWQHIATIYAGYAPEFTFRSGETGSNLLGHGQDFTIPLALGGNAKTASVKVGDAYKKAIIFLKDGGVWKPVEPWAMSAGEWKPAN